MACKGFVIWAVNMRVGCVPEVWGIVKRFTSQKPEKPEELVKSVKCVWGLGDLQFGYLPEKPNEWEPPDDQPTPRPLRNNRGETRKMWRELFANPDGWMDVRSVKRDRRPDWIHRESKQGLWIESDTTPKWVRTRLAALPPVVASHPEEVVETFQERRDRKEREDYAKYNLRCGYEEVRFDDNDPPGYRETIKLMEMRSRRRSRSRASLSDQSDDEETGTSHPEKRPIHREKQNRTSHADRWDDTTTGTSHPKAKRLAALPPVEASFAKKSPAEERPSERIPAARGTLTSDYDLTSDYEEVRFEEEDSLEYAKSVKSMEMQSRISRADQWDDTEAGTSYPKKRTIHRRSRDPVVIGSDDDIRDLCLNGQPRNTLHILEQRGIDPSAYAYVCLLRRSTNLKDIAEGKYVHEHMANSDFIPSTFVLNALLNMYVKCGSLVDARQVFDRMRERDMFTWTMMLTGCAKLGQPKEAYKIYEQMRKERVSLDRITFTTILSVCTTLKSLEKGQRVHQDMRNAGIRPDTILGNTLIDMYAKCGNIKRGQQVFKEMTDRDVVTWNIMIAGSARNEAWEYFEAMREEGLRPDKVTYVSVLNACSSLEKGRALHSEIVESGFANDVRVGAALVNMFSKCGSVQDALRIFEKLPHRNVVSWTSMIAAYAFVGQPKKALDCYEEMLKEGILPDQRAYTSVLNVCATLGDLDRGQEVYNHMINSGVTVDLITKNTLIDMYCKCGRVEDAHRLLQNMKTQDTVSYTALIGGYVQGGQFQEALKVFNDMHKEGVLPNSVTFLEVLKACSGLGSIIEGRRIHASIGKAGLAEDPNIKLALSNMYSKIEAGPIQS